MEWTLASLAAEYGDEEFALFNGQRFVLREYLAYMRGRGEDDPRPLYLFEDLSLVAPGEAKAALLAEALMGPVTPALPASFVQLGGRVRVFLDAAAASMLDLAMLAARPGWEVVQ